VTVNVRCAVDSGWWPVSTRADFQAFQDAHEECEGIIEIQGSVDDLPRS
jgi:hypothetical protein